jgi:NAD(P)-dependent dehydrogenase (short-subunit alcohol dehydrogenase family)
MKRRVALVTGAASGIGAAVAVRLSSEGAAVAVVDRDGAGAAAVAASLPGPAVAVPADVAIPDQVDAAVNAAVESFGAVDLHHLNAGGPVTMAGLLDITPEDFDEVVAVNLRAVFLGVQAAFRQYRRQGTGGAIVVTSSVAGMRGSDDLVPYQAAKHGVLGIVQAAAVYGGPRSVRVNAIAPGLVLTGPAERDPDVAHDMRRRASTVPQRRAGTVDEIAGTVAFLLGDDAGYINGEVLVVDGGATVVNPLRESGGAGAWVPPPFERSS